jgi:hypothetical protein
MLEASLEATEFRMRSYFAWSYHEARLTVCEKRNKVKGAKTRRDRTERQRKTGDWNKWRNIWVMGYKGVDGRAMAQAVSRRPPTAEDRVRSRVSPCGICGGQSGIGTSFSPSTSVFPCQFHSTGAALHGNIKKKIIVITGLHNKPQDCGASVPSAAGPFTKERALTGRYIVDRFFCKDS